MSVRSVKLSCNRAAVRLRRLVAVLLAALLVAALTPAVSFADEGGTGGQPGIEIPAVPSDTAPTDTAPTDIPPTNTQPEDPQKPEPLKLRNAAYYTFVTEGGNAIALKGVSLKNGKRLALAKKKKGGKGQQFFVIALSKNYHALKNSISFKAIGVKRHAKNGGMPLVQGEYKKGKNQRFKFVPTGDGWYLMKSALGFYVSARADKAGARLSTTSDRAKALKVKAEKSKYSSGNAKLDKKLKKLHEKIGSKGDTMKKSFNYIVKHYRFRDHPNSYKGDWIARYAYNMIDKGHGQCKNFASTLCILLRSYGHDARVVTGYVPSARRGWATHGWTEAIIGGKTYVFDADLHVEFRGRRNWYKMTYANAPVKYKIEKRW